MDENPSDTGRSAHVERRRDARAGIYVHVPFCARQCPYCDFAVSVERDIPHQLYASALIEEFDARVSDLEGRDIRTLYIGGGTPSVWSVEALQRFLEHVGSALDLSALDEVTLEANPVDISSESLAAWKDLGVTRLSLGVQSFQQEILRKLNRNHSASEAREAVERALANGPGLVSFDLMFGVPGQTPELWARDLDILGAYDQLAHVSGYNLTIEPGTAFARRHERGRLDLPDDDVSFEMLEMLTRRCDELGMERYEVSNYAREGARSRHNTLYWTGAEYLGIGVGAHSLRISPDGVARRANRRARQAYTDAPTEPEDVEYLTPIQHLTERLFLALRSRAGLDWTEIESQFEDAVEPRRLELARSHFDGLQAQGFVEVDDDVYRPTDAGLNLADALAQQVFALF